MGTRELAYQIKNEYDRFAKYFPEVKTGVFYGGMPVAAQKETLKTACPHIVIGTPGRVLQLVRDGDMKLEKCAHFVLDECDNCLEKLDMRGDVQKIFVATPKKKQVMMFSATLSGDIRGVCKKFMDEPHEIFVDDEAKLTLHGLLQYYTKLNENEKNRKANDLLDSLEFNQVVIFVRACSVPSHSTSYFASATFPRLLSTADCRRKNASHGTSSSRSSRNASWWQQTCSAEGST